MAQFTILAAEGPNGYFIPSDIYELLWGGLAFLIIFYLMVSKLFPFINRALEKGQKNATASAQAAEIAQAEAKAKLQAKAKELGDVDAECATIVADARKAAEQLKVDSAERTELLKDEAWAKAQSDVAAMKQQAMADVQAEVAAQAVGAAEHLVRDAMNDQRRGDLIEEYIAKVGASQ